MTLQLPGGSGDSSGPFDPVLGLRAGDAERREIGHPALRPSPWRRLFRWSATSAPVALLLLAGLAFGPRGLALLSPPVLSLLNPVVPIAVAALGLLVGLSLGERWPDDRPVLAGAWLGTTVILVVVSAGLAAIALTLMVPLTPASWILIAAGGICAATSLTLPAADPLEPRLAATRIVAIGVLLPILAGGLSGAASRRHVGRRRSPDGAGLGRHPGAGGGRLAAADARVVGDRRARVRDLGAAAGWRRGRCAVAVGALRRTGGRRVLALHGRPPARDGPP